MMDPICLTIDQMTISGMPTYEELLQNPAAIQLDTDLRCFSQRFLFEGDIYCFTRYTTGDKTIWAFLWSMKARP